MYLDKWKKRKEKSKKERKAKQSKKNERKQKEKERKEKRKVCRLGVITAVSVWQLSTGQKSS